MTKKSLLVNTISSAVLFCSSVTLAQGPVQDIDKKVLPNLAVAQSHVVQANGYIAAAQKDNKYDMHGHAEKARELLVQVNQELKTAAKDADEAAAASQKRSRFNSAASQGGGVERADTFPVETGISRSKTHPEKDSLPSWPVYS